jgi:hypothetical protein
LSVPSGEFYSIFYYVNLDECELIVPPGTKSLYQAADVWKDFGTITEAASTSTLSLSATELNFAFAGEQQSFNITSNVNWTVSSNASWLTISPTSGSNDGTVTATTSPNNATTSRTATITITGEGVTSQTITVTQAGLSPTLSISTTSLTFVAAGESKSIDVYSNTSWTATSNASWLTISPTSGSNDGSVEIKAAVNTNTSQRTATVVISNGETSESVSITQAAAEIPTDNTQSVVVTPGNVVVSEENSIDVSLKIPTTGTFTISFILTLPQGFILDLNTTALASGLLNMFRLEINPLAINKWRFDIVPSALRNSMEAKDVLRISYALDASVSSGEHDLKLTDMNLVLDNGQVFHQDEVKVQVRVASGNETVGKANINFFNGILSINTPVAEQISIYSPTGAVLFSTNKPAGEAVYNLSDLPKGIMIVSGSSGWVQKFNVN